LTAKNGNVTMLHGAGGTVMHDLVKNYILKHFRDASIAEVSLEALDDAAVVGGVVLKSDSHAVSPSSSPAGALGGWPVSAQVKATPVLAPGPTPLPGAFT